MSRKPMLTCMALVAAFGFVRTASAELIGYWSFDEGSGVIAKDESGNGNDGTLENGTEWTDGQSGYAVQFDGTDDCVNLGNTGNLSITGDFTFSMWVKISAYPTSWRNMLSKLVDDQHVEYNFRYKTATEGQFYYGTGSAAIVCSWNPTEDLPLNTWTHIAGVRKSKTHLKLYFNGVEKRTLNTTTEAVSTAANVTIGRQSNNTFYFTGIIDEVAIFSDALEEAEILSAMSGLGNKELASKPSPANEAVDVSRDVVLGWVAGEFAATHDVYLGTSYDAVAGASQDNPMGVLVSEGQKVATYQPDAILEYGQTYYWRIDEVNALPDNTVFTGAPWSFTVEPLAYPIADVVAASNVASAGEGPENLVNGSGLNADDQHSVDSGDMWLVSTNGSGPVQLDFTFDKVYKLYEMLVWNYNVVFEAVLGFGVNDATIEYSADGAEWTLLAETQFNQATARNDYAANTVIDMGGVAARAVRVKINSNFGSLTQYGLSEVRFFYTPVLPREPEPSANATNVSVDAVLDWRGGREAASHEVYFGTDAETLTLAGTVSESTFTPEALNYGETYYWQIVEVNEAEAISAWAGDVWSFSTQEYTVVDGFETYNDDLDAGTTIFDTWFDGWVNDTGSTVGYFDAPFAEKTIIHSGTQSMPLQYDNTLSPFYSEAEREFDTEQNWKVSGTDTLLLYFQGVPGPFTQLASGKIVMGAAGADIWNAADEFRFVYKPLSGNGWIVAYVESVANTDPWAKAGVMIRETLETGSTFAAVYATPGNGCRYQGRLTTDVAAVSDTSVATAEQIAMRTPYWVKIERVGNAFNGYYSTDGTNWTGMSWNPQTIAMASDAYVGLAVTSHSADVLASAEFSDVATTGSVTGQWTVATIGPEQPEGNGAGQLYVTLEDAAGKTATATHPAGNAAVLLGGWNEWLIPFSQFTGVNLSRVEVMKIGVGNPANPTAGGSGIIYVDDIGYGSPAAP